MTVPVKSFLSLSQVELNLMAEMKILVESFWQLNNDKLTKYDVVIKSDL